MHLFKIFSLFLLLVISVSNGYRILAVFPFYGRSHMGVLEQIAKGLAKKGHQVDVISHFPLKKPFPNYTDIAFLPDHTNHAPLDYSIFTVKDNRNQWGKKILRNICDYPGLPEFSKIIEEGKTKKKYDLLLVHVSLLTINLAYQLYFLNLESEPQRIIEFSVHIGLPMFHGNR